MSATAEKQSELLTIAQNLHTSWQQTTNDKDRDVYLYGIHGWGVWALSSPQQTDVAEIKEVVDLLEGEMRRAFLRGALKMMTKTKPESYPAPVTTYVNEAFTAAFTPPGP